MKLKMLREHYVIRKGDTVWTPKRSFDSVEQIREVTNYKLSLCHIYTCTFCGNLHIKAKH